MVYARPGEIVMVDRDGRDIGRCGIPDPLGPGNDVQYDGTAQRLAAAYWGVAGVLVAEVSGDCRWILLDRKPQRPVWIGTRELF